ncbi:MAG: NUDIX domain-containing protein [Gemmatimonadales bacterium]|nr:NUDIX domain-containing protein [Gemmatimonadales bacterium]
MTLRLAYVDVYVLRGTGTALEVLALRRAPGGRCPGSWETVHGHVEAGEAAHAAALRELQEETGLVPARFYNLSRVELFYRHTVDEVALVPVFAALVARDATVRLGVEHDTYAWLSAPDAALRFAWPREKRGVYDALQLVGGGDAGPLEDVLRVC